MKLQDIKTIADLKDYITQPGFQFSSSNRATLILTGNYSEEVVEDELQWRIWKSGVSLQSRYPFQNGTPYIMLFKQKTLEKKYSSGIMFPVNFMRSIKNITFDNGKIEIEVFTDRFYWRFDRDKMKATKDEFEAYKASDNFIISNTSKQMDSQSPSHNGVIHTDLGLKF
jgi:hypothetical protein